MAKIKAFCGLRYNPVALSDLSRLVCPPYDVISRKDQQYYHSRSPYNLIRLILGKDIPGQNKYQRAKKYFDLWLKKNIFISEAKPAIYFYRQQYRLKRKRFTRLGFIALLRLPVGKSAIFPHEYTHSEARADRLKLLRAVRANLSPIFVLFCDRKAFIQKVYRRDILSKAALINIVDPDKVRHKVWKIDDGRLIKKITKLLVGEDIFIADGHHRYEVANLYRELIQRQLGDFPKEHDINYIMAYFTNVESPGLTILPIHRFVRGVKLNLARLEKRLNDYFMIEEVKHKDKFFNLLELAGGKTQTLGLYLKKRFYLLRLKQKGILDRIIKDKPRAYRRLDVALLNHVVLERVLRQRYDDKAKVSFSADAAELVQRADREPGGIVFFLNPVKIERLLAVACLGERMPPKTTYFYPKVLSGIVINKLQNI